MKNLIFRRYNSVYTISRMTDNKHIKKGETVMDSNKRPEDMLRITTAELAEAFIQEQVSAIQEQVGDKKYCSPCQEVWILPW